MILGHTRFPREDEGPPPSLGNNSSTVSLVVRSLEHKELIGPWTILIRVRNVLIII